MRRRFFIGILTVLSVICVGIGALTAKNVSADADESAPFVFYQNANTLSVSAYEDGYQLTGKSGRGRSGFVLNDKINIGTAIRFSFSMLVDSGSELAQGAPQNRAYVITANEYENGAVNAAAATHMTNCAGWQLEVRTTFGLNPYIDIMSHGGRYGGKELTEEKYPYFMSALWNKQVAGVVADTEIQATAYMADSEGNVASRQDFTHYTVKLEASDKLGAVRESINLTMTKEQMLGTKADFDDEVRLGMFVINEPAASKEIDVDMRLRALDNGKTSSLTAEETEIIGIKAGERVQIHPVLIPRKVGTDVSDITFTFVSRDSGIVTVDEAGKVSATGKAGATYVDVYSSDGHKLSVYVLPFDGVKPVLQFYNEYSYEKTYKQYSKIKLSNFTAYDEGGAEIGLEVISPISYVFDIENSENSFEYELTEVGDYVIQYKATDSYGNITTKLISFTVTENESVTDWTKYGSLNSYTKMEKNSDGGVHFTGVADSREFGDEQTGGMYYNNGIVFTKQDDGSYTDVEFSFFVDYKKGNPIDLTGDTSQSRFLFFSLVEGTAEDEMGAGRVDWNMPAIMLSMGQRHTSNGNPAQSELIWYELRAGTTQLSRQFTTVIDAGVGATAEQKENARLQREGAYAGGLTYIPWFKDGDARNWASKFTTGKEMKVRIEYYDENSPGYEGTWNENYYVLTMDSMRFRIPAKKVAGVADGFRRQAYISFKYRTVNGELPFDLTVSKISNGDTAYVGYKTAKKDYYSLGEEFNLGAIAVGNNGETLADSFTYQSKDASVATVDANGVVKIVGVGITSIKTISKKTGKVGVFNLTVGINKLNILKDEYTFYLDEDGKIDLEIEPNVKVPVSYKTSNPRIVAALNNGTLQAVGVGEVTLTVSYGKWQDTCVIKVLEKKKQEGDNEQGNRGETPSDPGNSGNTPASSEESGCGGSAENFSAVAVAFGMAVMLILRKSRVRKG